MKKKSLKKKWQVHYDSKADILYMVYKKGPIEETIEAAPGVHLEYAQNKELVGVEFLDASHLFKKAFQSRELIVSR